MGCYDYREERKRIERLAALWEAEKGVKTVIVEHRTGTRRWYTFEEVIEPDVENAGDVESLKDKI